MKTLKFSLLALSALALSVATQADLKYQVISLGHLPGSQGASEACAISPDGRISGSAINSQGFQEQFYWDRATTMIGLGMLPISPGIGCGQGVNSNGVVVGYYMTPEGNYWPTVWDQQNGLRKLPAFMGQLGTGRAFAINDRGQIVGENSRGTVHHACLWDPSLGTIDLGVIPGDLHSRALAIDDNGTITGDSQGDPKSAAAKVFLWEPAAGMKNLGQLVQGYGTEGDGINNGHTIIGTSYYQSGHGFYWNATEGMVHIESPSEAVFGMRANAINATGQVVGQMLTVRGPRAFIWTKQTGMVDLNFTLGAADKNWMIVNAKGINDSGWIAADAYDVTVPTQRAVLVLPALYP